MDHILQAWHTFGRGIQCAAMLHGEAVPGDLFVKTFFIIGVAHYVLLIHSFYMSLSMWKFIQAEW